jgi:hypothetical protein
MEASQPSDRGGTPIGDDEQAPPPLKLPPIDEPEKIPLDASLAAEAPAQISQGSRMEYASKPVEAGIPPANHIASQDVPEIPEPADQYQIAPMMSQSRDAAQSSPVSTLDISAENLAVGPQGGIVKGSAERIELAPKPPSREETSQTPPAQQMPAQVSPPKPAASVNAPKPEPVAKRAEIRLPEGEFLKMFPDARPD